LLSHQFRQAAGHGFSPPEDRGRRHPRDCGPLSAWRAARRRPALQSALDAAELPGRRLAMTVPAKTLVIGSNSFSGAQYVKHLLEQGGEVVGISRSPEPHRAFLPYRWKDHT